MIPMRFKKFLAITILFIILVNTLIIFEPLIVLTYERSNEKSNPVSNGSYFDYQSSVSLINCYQGNIPTVSPIKFKLNLTVSGDNIICKLSISSSNFKDVSNLGFHQFYNRTRSFNIDSIFIQNFLYDSNSSTDNRCFEIDNETLGYLGTSEDCGYYDGFGSPHMCALEVSSYGFEGYGFVGGPRFNKIYYARTHGIDILTGASVFTGNPAFLFTMLNDTTFSNDTIKGVTEASMSLVKTNVQLGPIFYTYYLIKNFFFNVIFTLAVVAYVISVYTLVRRKRKRG